MVRGIKPVGKILALVLAIVCSSGIANAAPKENSLEVGYLEFPPFFYTSSDGQAEGTLIRLAEKVFAKMGRAWHPAAYPAARLMENVKKGRTDVVMLIKNATLANDTIYGKEAIATIRLRAYWRGKKEPITSASDMVGKSAILLRGFSYSGLVDFFKDPANKVRYSIADGHVNAFEMLRIGRGDYVLDYVSPATKALEKVKIEDISSSLVQEFDVYFIVSKKTPNAEVLAAQIEAALRQVSP